VNQVRMYHAALDTHVSVPESAVDIHRVSGWIPADEYVPPVEAPAKEPAAEKATEERKPIKAGSRRSAEEQ
jgi:hypothetical protein